MGNRKSIALWTLLGVAALSAVAQAHADHFCVESWDRSVDYFDNDDVLTGFPDGTEISYADGFTISYHGHYKVITVFDPRAQLNGGNYEQYVLWLCGTDVPTASQLETAKEEGLRIINANVTGYSGDLTQKTFQVPVETVVAAETVSISFLTDSLGAQDHVKYFSPYATSPCFQEALQLHEDEGVCTYEGLPPGYNAFAFAEEEVALADAQHEKADVVFDSTFDNSDPKQAAFLASADPGPLNRAEWVKMIGAFFNLEDRAEADFKDTSDRYNKYKADAQAAISGTPTKIAWIAHEEPFPSYGIMDGKFVVSFAAYKLEHVADAGGVNPTAADLPNGTAAAFDGDIEYIYSIQGSDEEDAIVKKNAAAKLLADLASWGPDVVIDETYAPDPTTYDLNSFRATYCLSIESGCQVEDAAAVETSLPFMSGEGVVRQDRAISASSKGLDWFESLIPNPNRLMEDLLQYTAPSVLPATFEPYYLRNVSKNEPFLLISSDACLEPLPQCPQPEATSPETNTEDDSGSHLAAVSATLLAASALALMF